MITADEQAHNQAHDGGNGNGRDGVGVEYLQQFNVRGNYGNQIAFIPALQLGGGQSAQSGKDLISDKSQQFKGDKMVASLLGIAKDATGHGKQSHAQEQKAKAGCRAYVQDAHHGISCKNGDKLSG